jgi:hypothetical protein
VKLWDEMRQSEMCALYQDVIDWSFIYLLFELRTPNFVWEELNDKDSWNIEGISN